MNSLSIMRNVQKTDATITRFDSSNQFDQYLCQYKGTKSSSEDHMRKVKIERKKNKTAVYLKFIYKNDVTFI